MECPSLSVELDAETATTLSIGCLRLPRELDATLPRPSFERAPFSSCATSSGACGEANYRRVTNSKLSIIALRHAAAGCAEKVGGSLFLRPTPLLSSPEGAITKGLLRRNCSPFLRGPHLPPHISVLWLSIWKDNAQGRQICGPGKFDHKYVGRIEAFEATKSSRTA